MPQLIDIFYMALNVVHLLISKKKLFFFFYVSSKHFNCLIVVYLSNSVENMYKKKDCACP